jgi:plastocyanin
MIDFMSACLRPIAISLAILAAHAGASAATLSVQVSDAAGKPLQDAAVYAEPLSPTAGVRPKGTEIEQQGKKFMPVMTVVQTGSEIGFPNNDTVRHHVYSFSPKAFRAQALLRQPGHAYPVRQAGHRRHRLQYP